MPLRFQPVTLGSPEFHSAEVGSLRVTDARFPPLLALAPHVHERPIVAVLLEGSWREVMCGRTHECLPTTVITEPAGERHANYFEEAGARVLVVEADPSAQELLRPCARLLETPQCRADGLVAAIARRAAAELRAEDDASRLALEGLALELLAAATRQRQSQAERRAPKPWLRRAQDLMHDRFHERLRLTEVATAVGVHPAHLARVFRSHFGLSLGAYQRQLRLGWAAQELLKADQPLSRLAVRAGFADQSHFTRAFKGYAGVTPARYRRTRAR